MHLLSNFNVVAVRFSISLKEEKNIQGLSITFITMNGGKSFLHHVGFIVHFTKTVLVTQDTYIMEMDRSCFCCCIFKFLFNVLFSLHVNAYSILYPRWPASLTLAEWETREQQIGTNMVTIKNRIRKWKYRCIRVKMKALTTQRLHT